MAGAVFREVEKAAHDHPVAFLSEFLLDRRGRPGVLAPVDVVVDGPFDKVLAVCLLRGTFTVLEMSGPPSFLAPPLSPRQLEERRHEEEARRRYLPRADWTGMGYRDWGDAALIRARLEAGAPPDARVQGDARPLHLAVSQGQAEAVAALLAHGAEIDVRDEEGRTPLWYAACGVDEGMVRALIEAGADVWTPQEEP
ncbi:ankyrin repeat domain-containing protein [Streptomyces microflavus]|uniref:ankyrin repeat domain-containing protein n=1 Tax=Streptomyces microflavus TaxID=1919 RepID=UPI0033A891AD